MAKIVPNNLVAFPPSMVVIVRGVSKDAEALRIFAIAGYYARFDAFLSMDGLMPRVHGCTGSVNLTILSTTCFIQNQSEVPKNERIMTRLAITPGEPAGIGPDILIQLVQQPQTVELVAVADPELLRQRARDLKLPLIVKPYSPETSGLDEVASIQCLPVTMQKSATPGKLNVNNAGYVLETLTRAADGCLSGEFDAMVTGPIHKGIINEAGVPFTGHTEFLAARCGDHVHPVMMLATKSLRVALVTTHLPLKDISAAITPERLERVCRILHHDMQQRFKVPEPRILVCGLNPHAGEDGHLGMEEIEVISPVLEKLVSEGLDLVGPLPADTLFAPRLLDDADAVLAMYHDQGLPVLKFSGFGEAVNITLGLPIIRTSVDHGTALTLAATGKAATGSLQAAIDNARIMAG